MIQVKDLSKTFGDVAAVKSVSFSAAKGEVVGFLGSNGAGKTTTLRMLTGYLKPSAGSAAIGGFDVRDASREARNLIGYLPEKPPLYDELTVAEYLRFVGAIRGLARQPLLDRIEELLARLQLQGVRNRLCGKLSKGFRQRVGLAQSLMHRPRVLILDEPTNGLDPQQTHELRNIIRSLAAEGTTILVSTHLLPEVAATCGKVVILENGTSVLEKHLAEMRAQETLEQLFLQAVTGGVGAGAP